MPIAQQLTSVYPQIVRRAYQLKLRAGQAFNKASEQEQNLSNEQAAFYKTLTNNYNTQFAGQSSILNSLKNAFTPILAAGPGQQGFTAPELAAMRTQAADTTAQAYAQARQAVNEKVAEAGGGNAYLPSGAAAQSNAGLASQAAQANAAQQNQITQQNYGQGLKNFQLAASALSGTAGLFDPTAFAGQGNSAGQNAFGSANTINQENNAWKGELGGAIGGVTSNLFGGHLLGILTPKKVAGGT